MKTQIAYLRAMRLSARERQALFPARGSPWTEKPRSKSPDGLTSGARVNTVRCTLLRVDTLLGPDLRPAPNPKSGVIMKRRGGVGW